MRIYIAGSISGDPNYLKKFAAKEAELRREGHVVFNPAKNKAESYKGYIDAGLYQLQHSEAIYLMKDYMNSKGALLEKHYAEAVGLKVIYEEVIV